MTTLRDAIVGHYLRREALATGTFTLAGGGTSDFYIDGRRVTTDPAALRDIALGMVEVIRDGKLAPPGTTVVAPVVSGIPIAVALALQSGVPFVMDRGAPKGHGHGRRFEGVFEAGDRCLLVDDLVTVGSTIVKSVEGLRAEGRQVSDVVVVVDRQEGAEETLASLGVRLHSLVTKADLTAALKTASDG